MSLFLPSQPIRIEVHPPASRIRFEANFPHISCSLNRILIEAPRNQYEDKRINRGGWSKKEDELLQKAVEKFGNYHWTQCAFFVSSRTAKQCRDRWCNHLRPDLDKSFFEKWEDELIIKQHDLQGNKWSNIASMLPNRSVNSVKNRWYSKLAKELNSSQSQELKC